MHHTHSPLLAGEPERVHADTIFGCGFKTHVHVELHEEDAAEEEPAVEPARANRHFLH